MSITQEFYSSPQDMDPVPSKRNQHGFRSVGHSLSPRNSFDSNKGQQQGSSRRKKDPYERDEYDAAVYLSKIASEDARQQTVNALTTQVKRLNQQQKATQRELKNHKRKTKKTFQKGAQAMKDHAQSTSNALEMHATRMDVMDQDRENLRSDVNNNKKKIKKNCRDIQKNCRLIRNIQKRVDTLEGQMIECNKQRTELYNLIALVKAHIDEMDQAQRRRLVQAENMVRTEVKLVQDEQRRQLKEDALTRQRVEDNQRHLLEVEKKANQAITAALGAAAINSGNAYCEVEYRGSRGSRKTCWNIRQEHRNGKPCRVAHLM